MLAERTLRIAADFAEEIDTFGLVEILQRAALLSSQRASLNDQQYDSEAQKMRNQAQKILDQTKISKYPREYIRALQNSEFETALPSSVARALLSGLPIARMRAMSSGEFSLIAEHVQRVRSELRGFIAFANSFHLQSASSPVGALSIDIVLPRALFDDDVSKFADKLQDFDNFLTAITEYQTGSRTKPKLQNLSTSDPVTTVQIVFEAAAAVFAAYTAALEAAERSISLYRSITALKESGLETEEAEKLTQSMQASIEINIKHQIEVSLGPSSSDLPPERANELRNEVRLLSVPIVNDIANGARIGLSLESSSEPSELNDAAQIESTDLQKILQSKAAVETRVDSLMESTSERIHLLSQKSDPLENRERPKS